MWLGFLVGALLGLCGIANAADPLNFQPHQVIYQVGDFSKSPPLNLATRLEPKLQKMTLPSYLILIAGEGTGQPAVQLLDTWMARWAGRIQSDRYVVMVVKWSQDCGSRIRRPGHDSCDFAIRTGYALDQLGVNPQSAGADRILPEILIEDPSRFFDEIPKLFDRIAQYEQTQIRRAAQDRAQVDLELTRLVTILDAFRGDQNEEEAKSIRILLDQIEEARQSGSVAALLEAKGMADAHLQLLLRFKEERQRISTLRRVTWVGAGAILTLLGLYLWVRARRRIQSVQAHMDPARLDLQHHLDRFKRAQTVLEALYHRTDQIRSDLPRTALMTLGQIQMAQRIIQEASRQVDAALRYLEGCAGAIQKRAVLVALMTGQCPGSDLGRRLRGTYRVDVPISGHDLFGSGARTRYVRLEEAEPIVMDLFATATHAVQQVEKATQFLTTHIASRRASLDYEMLKQQAQALRVPLVWLSLHPYLKSGEGVFENLKHMAQRDPLVAIEELTQYDSKHELIKKNVEQIGVCLARIIQVRVVNLVIPVNILVDPADNPRNTLLMAASLEEALFRLIEAPVDSMSIQTVLDKTTEITGLYEKGLAQHAMLLRAYRQAPHTFSVAEEKVREIQDWVLKQSRNQTNRTLIDLRIGSVKQDLKSAKEAIQNLRYVGAVRILEMVMAELERIEEETTDQEPTQEAPSEDPSEAPSEAPSEGSSEKTPEGSTEDPPSEESGNVPAEASGDKFNLGSGTDGDESSEAHPVGTVWGDLPAPTEENKRKLKEQREREKREKEERDREAQRKKEEFDREYAKALREQEEQRRREREGGSKSSDSSDSSDLLP